MSRKLITLGLIALTVMGAVYLYMFAPFEEQILRYPSGSSLGPFDKGYYSIDPETILNSLAHGQVQVFVPEPAPHEAPILQNPVAWSQSDYMKIGVALHQLVWKESLDGWNLYEMGFSTPCQDGITGFSLGEFSYFKTVFYPDGRIGYTARGLQISPQYGDVRWAGNAKFPHPLLGWKSIRLDRLIIDAGEALRIAEENGGLVARLSVNNNCTIRLKLSGQSGWIVRITDDQTASELFRIEIDAYTGKIR